MKLKILLSALLLCAGSLAFKNQGQDATAPQLAANEKVTILASTLQIAMFEHAPEAGGTESGGQGLGTLVARNDALLIVTHDHWTHLTPNLHEVELRDASGQLLLTLDAQTFRTLITYRDGGTMVLQAPKALVGLVPAAFATPSGDGNTVWFARRAVASGYAAVEVVAATVTSVEDTANPASMQLRTVDGNALLPGDSGGGVWANGQLLGNVWAAGVRETRYFWSAWFGSDSTEPSDLVIAALQPLVSHTDAATQVRLNLASEQFEAHVQQEKGR